jgi:hypothetical protein
MFVKELLVGILITQVFVDLVHTKMFSNSTFIGLFNENVAIVIEY